MSESNVNDAAKQRVLILGGTADARALADALAVRGCDVTTSLAGRTLAPTLPQGKIRSGGFGGADGLAQYLQAEGITHLIDATHPFAARISANAVVASAKAGVPLVRLERPAWTRVEGTDWVHVPDMSTAAALLPEGARVFLTIGRQELGAFHGVTRCTFVARVIEPPQATPPGWTVIAARGPFSLATERETLKAHAITHLVTKNSGGSLTAAKLDAARELGLTVVMVARPTLPPAPIAATLDDAVAWVDRDSR